MIKYEQLFWDDIVNENLDKLKLQIHLIENRDIVEIDTVEELNQIEKCRIVLKMSEKTLSDM